MKKRPQNARGEGEKLRMDLITAAIKMLEQPQTIAAPSLRKIAQSIGISPSAVYTRFESGQQLLQETLDYQYQILREAISKAAHGKGDSYARLENMAIRYVTWGVEHPGIYQLLFESADKLPEGIIAQGPGIELLNVISTLVAEFREIPKTKADQITYRIWIALHGIVSLRIHKKNAPWKTEASDETKKLLQAIITK